MRCQKPLAIGLMNRNRLLGQNMQTLLQGVNPLNRMEVVRGRYQEGVNLSGANHLFAALKNRHLLCIRFQTLRGGVTHRRQLRMGHFSLQ